MAQLRLLLTRNWYTPSRRNLRTLQASATLAHSGEQRDRCHAACDIRCTLHALAVTDSSAAAGPHVHGQVMHRCHHHSARHDRIRQCKTSRSGMQGTWACRAASRRLRVQGMHRCHHLPFEREPDMKCERSCSCLSERRVWLAPAHPGGSWSSKHCGAPHEIHRPIGRGRLYEPHVWRLVWRAWLWRTPASTASCQTVQSRTCHTASRIIQQGAED